MVYDDFLIVELLILLFSFETGVIVFLIEYLNLLELAGTELFILESVVSNMKLFLEKLPVVCIISEELVSN